MGFEHAVDQFETGRGQGHQHATAVAGMFAPFDQPVFSRRSMRLVMPPEEIIALSYNAVGISA